MCPEQSSIGRLDNGVGEQSFFANRTRIVLSCVDGMDNKTVAAKQRVTEQTVSRRVWPAGNDQGLFRVAAGFDACAMRLTQRRGQQSTLAAHHNVLEVVNRAAYDAYYLEELVPNPFDVDLRNERDAVSVVVRC
jgi:hypothetical protein